MTGELELTKEEVQDLFQQAAVDFDIDSNGNVTSPGRFQSEPDYVLYYFALLQDGGPDFEDGDGDAYFEIKKAEREVFPNLPDDNYIYIQMSDQGFVGHGFSASLPDAGVESEGGDL